MTFERNAHIIISFHKISILEASRRRENRQSLIHCKITYRNHCYLRKYSYSFN